MGEHYVELDDSQLWMLVKEKADAAAFAALHIRFSRNLYRLAHQKTGNGEIAEDIVQDLFIALWTGREQIIIEKSVGNYLFSALKNRIISYFRKEIVRNAMSLDVVSLSVLSNHAYNNVDDHICFSELYGQYQYHLNSLPEKTREVFELSRSGFTNREIAARLNIVEKTVEFHISKCLRVLKNNLVYLLLLFSI